MSSNNGFFTRLSGLKKDQLTVMKCGVTYQTDTSYKTCRQMGRAMTWFVSEEKYHMSSFMAPTKRLLEPLDKTQRSLPLYLVRAKQV